MIRIMLDSGAHSLYTTILSKNKITQVHYGRKSTMVSYDYTDTKEFKDYLDNYIKFLLEHKDSLELYVNLDIIGNAEKTWEIQKYMESFGLTPLPVFHHNEDFKWLKKYVENYEYIGIGGVYKIFPKNYWIRNYGDPCFSIICDSKGMPKVKVHCFSMTSPEIIINFPFYSVDSTSWVLYSKYGLIITPKARKDGFSYIEPPWVIYVSSRKATTNKNTVHVDNISPFYKKQILEYIESKGYSLGKSEFKTVINGYKLEKDEVWGNKEKTMVEMKKEMGLINDHRIRDQFNLQYFLDLEQNLPPWPWPWRKKFRTGGLL